MTEWKLSQTNEEFVKVESERLGISLNGALNVLLAELRYRENKEAGAELKSQGEQS